MDTLRARPCVRLGLPSQARLEVPDGRGGWLVKGVADYQTFWGAELGDRIVTRRGQNWLCRSPFREDRHPSFSVDTARGLFHDFGDPSKRGDIIDFLRIRDSLSYGEAKAYLHARYGVDVLPRQAPQGQGGTRATRGQLTESKEPEKFCYVEAGSDLRKRREWRARRVPAAEYLGSVDCYGKAGVGEAYASMFVHSEDIVAYKREHGGSVGGYCGPVLAPFVAMDFDDAGDPDKARRDVIKAVEAACGRYGANIDNLRVYFSGRKGFHLYLLNAGLADLTCSEDTPLLVRRIAEKIGEGCTTLDLRVYDSCTRLLRVPNSLHAKSRLYKIPLLLSEVYTKNVGQIAERAKAQRSLRDAVKEMDEGGDHVH